MFVLDKKNIELTCRPQLKFMTSKLDVKKIKLHQHIFDPLGGLSSGSRMMSIKPAVKLFADILHQYSIHCLIVVTWHNYYSPCGSELSLDSWLGRLKFLFNTTRFFLGDGGSSTLSSSSSSLSLLLSASRSLAPLIDGSSLGASGYTLKLSC